MVVFSPGLYAIIGGGAFSGAVTGAVSTAILVLEATGNASALLLCFGSTIIAVSIAGKLHDPVYVVMTKFLSLPFLPDLSVRRYNLKAKDLCEPITHYITAKSSLRELEIVLVSHSKYNKKNFLNYEIPVVTKSENPVLVASIYYKVLATYIEQLKNQLDLKKNPKILDTKFNTMDHLKGLLHGIPCKFSPSTSIVSIHQAFIVFKFSNAFITSSGVVIGMITRSGLTQAIEAKNLKTEEVEEHFVNIEDIGL